MIKDKKVNVHVDEGGYDIPTKASEFMAYWQKHLDKIPYEYMDEAHIDIDTYEDYGSARLEVEIYYKRPETPAEQKDREQRELSKKDIEAARKIAEFHRLKAELGL